MLQIAVILALLTSATLFFILCLSCSALLRSFKLARNTLGKFNKRTYQSFGQFWGDVSFLLRNFKNVLSLVHGKQVSPAFRERLVLATTAVNKCRYCTYIHTKLALREDIQGSEIDTLLRGYMATSPPEEVPALIYAQHLAETNASPSPEAAQKLKDTYGDNRSKAIEIVLRVAMTGNLMGNTWDYFLYCISFGRWGL